jgi:hypothetical protein
MSFFLFFFFLTYIKIEIDKCTCLYLFDTFQELKTKTPISVTRGSELINRKNRPNNYFRFNRNEYHHFNDNKQMQQIQIYEYLKYGNIDSSSFLLFLFI